MTSKDNDYQVLLDRLRGVLSRERCWDIINELNSEAYDQTYELWRSAEAGRQEKGDDEAFQDGFEEASEEQRDCFRDLFYDQQRTIIESVWYWVDNDSKFKDQFEEWFGDTNPVYRM